MHQVIKRERNILPVPEDVHDLGWGTAACATPIFPRYSRLLEYAFGQAGLDAAHFRAFRVSMQYPPIPTVVLPRSELPVRES